MDVKTKLGNRITELRLQKGLNREDLSRKAGLHRSYLGKIEKGIENPTIKDVSRIVDVLDVSLTTLFDFESVTEEGGNPVSFK